KTDTAGSLSVAGNFNSCFGIVGEVGGNYARYQVLGTDIDLSMHSFVGGPRFSSRNVARATPFARLLVGAAFKPVVMANLRYRGRGGRHEDQPRFSRIGAGDFPLPRKWPSSDKRRGPSPFGPGASAPELMRNLVKPCGNRKLVVLARSPISTIADSVFAASS